MTRTPAGKGTQIALDRTNWHRCSRCVVEYFSNKANPRCPACAMELKYEQMRESLKVATNSIERLEKDVTALSRQTDLGAAIKDATDLLGAEDRTFLKTVLYQFRQDRSVALKVIHSAQGSAIGFMAQWRQGDPEARECSSIGGRAIAGYFEEAQNAMGSAASMNLLLRAAGHLLPGGMA